MFESFSMNRPKEKVIDYGDRDGVVLRFTRKGLTVSGWYDRMVHIEGGVLSWSEIDKIRADLNAVEASKTQ